MKYLNTLIGLLLLCIISTAQSSSSLWENSITGTNPGMQNPYTTNDVVASGITVSGIGHGAGITGASGNDIYNATQWTVAPFLSTPSLVSDEYFTFTITPSSGKKASFSSLVLTFEKSLLGPLHYDLRSNVDDFENSINTGTLPVLSNSLTFSLTGTDFQNKTTPIEFRLYAWGATNGAAILGIGDFEFTGTVANVLPVTLSNFEAMEHNGYLNVRWVTLTETNNDYFEVQLSRNGIDFETIKAVKSQNGNSEIQQQYDILIPPEEMGSALLGLPAIGIFVFFCLFRTRRLLIMLLIIAMVSYAGISACGKNDTDLKEIINNQLFARIKQVDKDGSETRSKIIKVKNH